MTKFNIGKHIPLVAILRGIEPKDILRIASILKDEGFSMIEVPLNSPNALESIRLLVENFDLNKMLIGAGTVTTPELAKNVIKTGANLIVTPNYNEDVVKVSVKNDCVVFPGIVTPSEAFNALAHGATGLKIFPVSALGEDGFSALQSVLPPSTYCFPVGGINPNIESMKPYTDRKATGFGLGSALYKPNMTDEQIRSNAREFVRVFLSLTK